MAHLDEKKYGNGTDYPQDVNAVGAGNGEYSEEVLPAAGLQRQLKSRHLAMISIGGVM